MSLTQFRGMIQLERETDFADAIVGLWEGFILFVIRVCK